MPATMRLTRLTLVVIALIIGAGFYLLVRKQLDEVEPQTFQATEETLVDFAHLLAEMVEAEMDNGGLDANRLRDAFTSARARRFEARIYNHLKTRVGVHVYVTDAQGIVLFDSDNGWREGMDLSNYRDVARTLRGVYGARSTREVEDDDSSSVFYVAAPIGDPEKPDGVLTVYKPQSDVMPIVHRRRLEVWWGTGLIGGGILFLVITIFIWQYRPISRLTDYARAIEQGARPALPKLGAGREVNTLAHALESMRESLEGRRYVESYVQTLTHEMKSPLAAIHGAAELLDESMPAEDRRRFIANILSESKRAERVLNRLLELSAVEGRAHLESRRGLDFREIVQRAVDQAAPTAELADVTLDTDFPEKPVMLFGDAFVLRAAVTNLLENAIDFSPRKGTVTVRLADGEDGIHLSILDEGPGIPDYARERVFDRFFSVRNPDSGRKGSGLGLTLVREAAELHHGTIELERRETGGTHARLTLPRD